MIRILNHTVVRGLLPLLALALAARPVPADDASPAPRRVPWTTSRFSGTPDPPRPYVVERVFDRLSFDRPVLLESLPGTNLLVLGEVGGMIVTFPDDPGQADRADLMIDLKAARPALAALYGLAFHPRFAENGFVYLCYVLQGDKPDGTRVSRFIVRRDADQPPRIDPATEKPLISWLAGGHNGGCLAFGNDGFLYISTGDGAGPTPPDPLNTGQDVTDLLSSILRIDVDQEEPGKPYRIPPDNPLRSIPGARTEIWAYGFRNPWKMTFDRATGSLWVGDVGWELWELVYRVEPGGNYGWSVTEGLQPIHPEGLRGPTPIRPPIVAHPHSEAASITGGYVYHGQRLPELQGLYIYGDYQSGKLWSLRPDSPPGATPTELAETGLRLVAFGEDRRGELYLVEHERSNGIYRLVPNPARDTQTATFPRTLSATGLFASTAEYRPAPGVLPYAINAGAWGDGTTAERWLAVPGTGRLRIDRRGRIEPSEGTVLARTVSLDRTAGDPTTRRRLETQILHHEAGSWRPYTYIWNDEQTDAILADAAGLSRTWEIRDPRAPGGRRAYTHRFAARTECALCHNPWVEARTTVFGVQSASPLAFQVAQLDRPHANGASQLDHWRSLGLLDGPNPSPAATAPLVDPHDESADLTARARSYLHVNCSHCHQFNAGGAATILLDAALPVAEMKALDARPGQGVFQLDDARIIAPGQPERSVLLYRIAKTGGGRMPRVGSQRVDDAGVRLIGDWIRSLAAPTPRSPEAARSWTELVHPDTPPEARVEAARHLTATTSLALRLALDLTDPALPESVREAVAAAAKDHPSVEVRDLFERFLPDDQRIPRLGETIDPTALLALPGDAERGRAWFQSSSAAQCRSCHTVDGKGTELGPDLGAIGSKYDRAELLRQILEPSRTVDPRYVAHQVATKDGQVHSGLIVEKTDQAVILRTAQNQLVRIAAGEIEQQVPLPRSLMPEQLLRDLTAQQAADLLAFLASLKGR